MSRRLLRVKSRLEKHRENLARTQKESREKPKTTQGSLRRTRLYGYRITPVTKTSSKPKDYLSSHRFSIEHYKNYKKVYIRQRSSLTLIRSLFGSYLLEEREFSNIQFTGWIVQGARINFANLTLVNVHSVFGTCNRCCANALNAIIVSVSSYKLIKFIDYVISLLHRK